MTDLRVYQIDAFTRERYQGNPAGVVANAAGLGDDHVQLIARELNNSETAFVLPAEGPGHDVRVRFFTPTPKSRCAATPPSPPTTCAHSSTACPRDLAGS